MGPLSILKAEKRLASFLHPYKMCKCLTPRLINLFLRQNPPYKYPKFHLRDWDVSSTTGVSALHGLQHSFNSQGFLGLAASLSYGAASEIVRRSSQSRTEGQTASPLMTEANLNRFVSKLSQMRGAALKMGQFMSIQGMGYPRH